MIDGIWYVRTILVKCYYGIVVPNMYHLCPHNCPHIYMQVRGYIIGNLGVLGTGIYRHDLPRWELLCRVGLRKVLKDLIYY